MATKKHYRIYCITELSQVEGDSLLDSPVTCPNSAGHSVDASSVSILTDYHLDNLSAVVDPGIADDINLGYAVDSRWINTVNSKVFFCTNNASGAATWSSATSAGNAAGNSGDIQVRGSQAGTFDVLTGLKVNKNTGAVYIGGDPGQSLGGLLLSLILNRNSWTQLAMQNLNGQPQATCDMIVSPDLGDDYSYYGDFGINGSGYSDSAYPLSLPLDTYLLCDAGNLTLGTLTASKDVVMHTGGMQLDDERLRLIDAAAATDAIAKLSCILRLNNYTTANRPTTPQNGFIGYNTTTSKFEGYEAGAWINLTSGGSVFGGNYAYAATEAESTTTSQSWQTKVTLSATLPAGNYRIGFTAAMKTSVSGKEAQARLRYGNSSTEVSVVSTASTVYGADGAFAQIALTADTYAFTLEYNCGQSQMTAYCRRARIEIWRVS